MGWPDIAFLVAGVIGATTAVIHGVLVQRLMIGPVEAAFPAGDPRAAARRRLAPLLLHFSAYTWFLGGVALVAAAFWLSPEARRAVGVLVGASYLFGALGNLWGTRGRHPGWLLMATAVALIVFGVYRG